MPTLRIGLFGLRGAGKTVALSVAYLAENCEGLEVTVRDDDTIRYLRPLAEALQRGEVPPPTMVAGPTRLRWSVQLGEASYELETIDFAGELLDVIGRPGDPVAEQMMKQLQTQVRDWFISCDAVVLFIDSTDHGTPRYRDALIRLLDEMSQRPTIRGSHQRAVVVVFTKGDQVAQSPEQLSSPSEIQRILEGHPLYQVVQRRLKQHAEQIQFGVFLSSALGWRFVSIRNPSQRQVMPCNLFAALRWGLEQAAQIVHGLHSQVLDELNLELEERRNGPYSWVWALAHSRSLNTMLEATDQDYQLTKGPYAAKLAELRQTVRRARSYQLRGVVTLCIGVLLVVLLTCWQQFRGEQVAVYDTYDQLVRGADSDKVVTRRLSYYRTSIEPRKWDWFWLLLDRRELADAQTVRDSEWEALDRRQYGDLCSLTENPTDPNYFAAVAKAAEGYLREGRHTILMKDAVKDLLRQIEAIKSTQEYGVRVQRVTIPKDSDLDGDWRGNPNCSVTVSMGSESRQTNKIEPAMRAFDGSFSIVFDQPLEPFRVTGGEHKIATVTVTTHRTIFPNNVASCEVTEQTLPLVHLNGSVRVTCKANKTITVYFDCPAARLSQLPPFKAP